MRALAAMGALLLALAVGCATPAGKGLMSGQDDDKD